MLIIRVSETIKGNSRFTLFTRFTIHVATFEALAVESRTLASINLIRLNSVILDVSQCLPLKPKRLAICEALAVPNWSRFILLYCIINTFEGFEDKPRSPHTF